MSGHPEIRRSELFDLTDGEQADQFFVALVGGNGEDLSVSETFHSKDSAYVNIEAQKRALEGEVRDLT